MRTYSYTHLEAFEQCPLKFKFKYLDKIETGVETIETFSGNRVHETLEKLYGDLWNGSLNSLDDLIHFYSERWDEERHSAIRVVRGTEEQRFESGIACIGNYYRANSPFDQSRTEALGEEVHFEIGLGWGGRRLFKGKADRIASRADGTHEIHDYKTGKFDESKLAKARQQLSLYQCAIQSMHPEARQVDLLCHYLQQGESFCWTRTQSDLVQIVEDTSRFIDEIESERRWPRFPAQPGPLCDWCEFREICPAWQ
jgi:putative RecB family exonuclease